MCVCVCECVFVNARMCVPVDVYVAHISGCGGPMGFLFCFLFVCLFVCCCCCFSFSPYACVRVP